MGAGHAMVVGDEEADRLAKAATSTELPPVKGLVRPVAMSKARNAVPQTSVKVENPIDSALPGKHTKTLYDHRPYREAAALCQVRTGKSRLRSYLATVGAVDSDKCECNGTQVETVRHFLFKCPRWAT